jgi:putative flippase GtrA
MLRTIIGFVVINGCTFLLDLGIVTLTHGVWGWPVPVSVTLGYAIAFSLSFFLNRRFNFRSEAPVGGQVIRYVGVVAVNFLVILLGLTTGLNALGVQYQLARIIAGACEAVFIFCSMRWFVFRAPRGRAAEVEPEPAERRRAVGSE